jgi:basic membrane protein A
MKKISKWLVTGITCLLACIIAVGLVGCGGSDDAASDDASSTDGGTKKVAMFIDGPVNDGGWGASCYDAMVQAAKDHGWETAYTESVAQADWVTVIQDYVDQGYDLIIAPGNQYIDAVEQAAKDNPDAHFCIFNAEVSDYDNIECTMPDTLQIGQVAGVMAGLMTSSNKIGFIGGVELDTTLNKIKGYTEAANKVNPDVTSDNVVIAYANSFSDSAKGKELATSMVAQGADVFFGDASIVDTGVREVLAEQGDGYYDIGQPGDLGGADDSVIAVSVCTDNVKMTNEVLDDLESGNYGKKTVYGNLSNGGVYVGTISDKIVPQETKDAFNNYIQQLTDGTF